MTREEVTNSEGYKVTKAALEWYENNQDLDAIDAFEAGVEWMARQGYVVEDEIAMCYNNGEPVGLSLYNFDIDNNTIGLKDGDKVIIQVRKK